MADKISFYPNPNCITMSFS